VDLDPGVWTRPRDEAAAAVAAAPAPAPLPFEPQMGWLGSGSDYTAYVDHLGIPAADVSFSGRYGVYHSVYDDFYWMDHFGDPGFYTHATAARLYTLIAMRAAGADVVPITLRPYAAALREHVDDLRRTAVRLSRAEPPKKLRAAGERLPTLVESVRAIEAAAAKVDARAAELAGRDDAPAPEVAGLNALLSRFERLWLLPEGLPGRPWFRHAIYAPGLTTGYAAWPMPGVRQALNDDDPALFDAQVEALGSRIRAATTALEAYLAGPGAEPAGGASR
jgi:N-acetylated-alpha-linked acidic dipeptidase